MIHNIISVSGGKDSTALLALAVVLEAENLQAVMADTGNEHPLTYEYVDYLSDWLVRQGHNPIRIVKADFSVDLLRRREYLGQVARGERLDKYGKVHHTPDSAGRAVEAMTETGNPFLDLCKMKGRFPSSTRAFCSEELKRNPILEQVMLPLMDGKSMILSWQGVRAEESLRRRYLPECEEVGGGLFNYRPLIKWKWQSVFEAHDAVGLKPNPLYSMGMKRVGCMPCINCGKDELLEISTRFPEEIERISGWERQVSACSKRESATFFAASDLGMKNGGQANLYETAGIHQFVKWAQTGKGGKTYDMFRLFGEQEEAQSCSSVYGLCERDEIISLELEQYLDGLAMQNKGAKCG